MNPTTTTTQQPATRRQLAYLRALAERTGTTFTYPRTRAAASREIRRLTALPAQTPADCQLEAHFDLDAENAARARNGDVPIRRDEVTGYGSSCTWSHNA